MEDTATRETLSPGAVLRPRRDVRYRVIDGEAVVIRQRAGEALGLNEVGSRLLDLLDGRAPVAAILERLAGEYEVDPAELERDALAFYGELLAIGLVEISPTGESGEDEEDPTP